MTDIYLVSEAGQTAMVEPATSVEVVIDGALRGEEGPQGNPGDAGPPGADGAPGATWHTGLGAPTTTYVDNDLYLNVSNGDIYKQLSGAWGSPIGNIQGSAGASGAAGSPGALWYTGAGAPSTLHNNSDLYLNTSTGDVYQQTAGAWGSPIENIKGPAGTGTGDMLKATYDPTNKAADAFSQDNMASGTTNKNYTATEQTKLGGIATGADVTATQLPVATHAATSKATPVDADELPLTDSAASYSFKKLTWANLKATAKTYFDTLYQPLNSTLTSWASKAVPTGTVVGTTDTQTLTGKRVTLRVGTTASTATPSINTDSYDSYGLTAQAVDITGVTVTGTPTDGQHLWVYIIGTATRNITWGTSFESGAATLPTATSGTTRLDVAFTWNTATSKWRCMASSISSAGTGNVTGPASATANNIAVYADTTGKVLSDGGKALPTGVIVGTSDTQTLTNKRVTKRVNSATSTGTPSVSTDTFDQIDLTAQAAAITSFTLSGTPTDGQEFFVRIKATGAFAITAPTNVQNSGVASFPTTTVSGKTISALLRYDSTAAKWVTLAADATGY